MKKTLLALLTAALAIGFGSADDKKPEEPKKAVEAKKDEPKKPAADTGKKGKAGKVAGEFVKADGEKITVSIKGDEGAKEVVFTTNDKTKFTKETDEMVKEGKKEVAKKEDIKIADVKTGTKISITAGEDKVVTELTVTIAKKKKADAKPEVKKPDEKKPEEKKPEVIK